MTLKKVLKYIDQDIKIRVWDLHKPEPIYEDYVYDFPKKLAKQYRLVKTEENNWSEAMFPIGDGFLRITVVKKEEK